MDTVYNLYLKSKSKDHKDHSNQVTVAVTIDKVVQEHGTSLMVVT